jgi:hypothetical protein
LSCETSVMARPRRHRSDRRQLEYILGDQPIERVLAGMSWLDDQLCGVDAGRVLPDAVVHTITPTAADTAKTTAIATTRPRDLIPNLLPISIQSPAGAGLLRVRHVTGHMSPQSRSHSLRTRSSRYHHRVAPPTGLPPAADQRSVRAFPRAAPICRGRPIERHLVVLVSLAGLLGSHVMEGSDGSCSRRCSPFPTGAGLIVPPDLADRR